MSGAPNDVRGDGDMWQVTGKMTGQAADELSSDFVNAITEFSETLRNEDQNKIKAAEMWFYWRILWVKWTDSPSAWFQSRYQCNAYQGVTAQQRSRHSCSICTSESLALLASHRSWYYSQRIYSLAVFSTTKWIDQSTNSFHNKPMNPSSNDVPVQSAENLLLSTNETRRCWVSYLQ